MQVFIQHTWALGVPSAHTCTCFMRITCISENYVSSFLQQVILELPVKRVRCLWISGVYQVSQGCAAFSHSQVKQDSLICYSLPQRFTLSSVWMANDSGRKTPICLSYQQLPELFLKHYGTWLHNLRISSWKYSMCHRLTVVPAQQST